MKVTQIIKNAITARIRAKCEEANKNNKLALEVEENRLNKVLRKHLEDLNKEWENTFKNLINSVDDSKQHFYCYTYGGVKLISPEDLWEKVNYCPNMSMDSDYANELRAKIKENELKADKYINDIILELELGANKSTLESLLNSVTF